MTEHFARDLRERAEAWRSGARIATIAVVLRTCQLRATLLEDAAALDPDESQYRDALRLLGIVGGEADAAVRRATGEEWR